MSNIKCPNCTHQFALNDALTDEMNALVIEEKNKMNAKWSVLKKELEEDFKLKQTEFENEKNNIAQKAKQHAYEEFAMKLKSVEEERNEKVKQLQTLQKKELDLLREKNELEQKQKNFEIELEKKVMEQTKAIELNVIKREQESSELKLREKDIQLESMKKKIEELKQKSEQGSMQAQGEAQELILEDLLKDHFPYDIIDEVGKGVKGADCIQTVCNRVGQKAGTIIFESKNTKEWKNEWIIKLKNDMRNQNADMAIIVTKVFPKNMQKFGEIDGVWVCNFSEVIPLVNAIRNGILKINEVLKSQENKGEKMQMLYNYLIGNEFKGQIESIVEGFMNMRNSIGKEKIMMEKVWKEREKQIEKVLLNTSALFGSVKGIAGSSIGDIPLLDGEY